MRCCMPRRNDSDVMAIDNSRSMEDIEAHHERSHSTVGGVVQLFENHSAMSCTVCQSHMSRCAVRPHRVLQSSCLGHNTSV